MMTDSGKPAAVAVASERQALARTLENLAIEAKSSGDFRAASILFTTAGVMITSSEACEDFFRICTEYATFWLKQVDKLNSEH